MRLLLCMLLLAGCTDDMASDVRGPFHGPVTRFSVDRFTLPADNSAARALGDDLNGDTTIDNNLGLVIATLAGQKDVTANAPDMIAAGAIASTVELQAEDLTTASAAGATYYGGDGEAATVIGGRIAGGVFESNPTRLTRVPGSATIHVPVFTDADPIVVELDAMELELTPDGTGGYDGLVRGGIAPAAVYSAIYAGVKQMIAADPNAHYALADQLDVDRDGTITLAEVQDSSLFRSLLAPDVTLFGRQMLSIGFSIHLSPCAEGTCASAAPADTCHDRVQDGSETGVDCGGACGACPTSAPSCSDGVRDGLETDVDCGWECGPCALGQHCADSRDCDEASGAICTTGVAYAPGTCVVAH